MHRFSALLILLMWSAASAQTTGTLAPAPLGAPSKADVPPGGCMPIGLTASGEMVFPIQCEGIIERARGKTVDKTVDQKVGNSGKAAIKSNPEKANNSEKDATANSDAPAISAPITKPTEKIPVPQVREVTSSNDAPGCKYFRSYQPISKMYRDFYGKRRPCL
jgi:hypothetical protein